MTDPPPTLANYPREGNEPDRATDSEAVPRWGRWAGCGCLFLPAGLFLLAMTGGLMLGDGPQPDGSIGQEPGRGGKIAAALLFAVVLATLGAIWSSGRPRRKTNAVRLVAGVVLIVVALHQKLMRDNAIVGLVAMGLGVVLTASAHFGDRPPESER